MKQLRNQIHLIPQKDHHLVFHPETYSVMKVSSLFGKILDLLQQGKSYEEIEKELEIDPGLIRDVERTIERHISSFPVQPLETPAKTKDITLYLNVSNACNLRCVYCYANSGTYNSPPGMMDEKVAFEAVDRFYENFGTIGTICIFGGEPLLHADLISPVCEYARLQAAQREVPPPRFSIVTNGTLLSDTNVEMLAKYGFGVTVSIDGPEEINDLLRPMTRGTGSYSTISSGLQRLKRVGIYPNIESTFTAKHLKLGISPKMLLEFFRDQYQTRTLTIAPVAATPGDEIGIMQLYEALIPAYREAVYFSLETLTSEHPILLFQANQVLRHLLTKRKKPQNQFCYTNLGKELFSVSSVGNIYPCQMMNDRPEFEMGHITDPSFSSGIKFKTIQNQFQEMNKEDMQCRNCWARFMCFMCVAGVEIETKRLRPIPQHRCQLIQGVIEEVLLYISAIRGDSKRWTKFCRNLFDPS